MGSKQAFLFSYQETLPAENDAAYPHLENWLCMCLDTNDVGKEEKKESLESDNKNRRIFALLANKGIKI